MNTKSGVFRRLTARFRGAALVEVMLATFIFISSSAFLLSTFTDSSTLLIVTLNHQHKNLTNLTQKEHEFTSVTYDQQWKDVTILGQLTHVNTITLN